MGSPSGVMPQAMCPTPLGCAGIQLAHSVSQWEACTIRHVQPVACGPSSSQESYACSLIDMQLNNAMLPFQRVGTPLLSVSLLSGMIFIDGDYKISNLNVSWGCVTSSWGVGGGTGEQFCSVAQADLGFRVHLFQVSLCWSYRYLLPYLVSLKILSLPHPESGIGGTGCTGAAGAHVDP